MNFEDFIQFPGPCQPIRIENYIPVYSSDQLQLYGIPENWGVYSYLVIETRETAQPMVSDYDFEMERKGSLRPIHRYSRVERFESTLYQLIACRGKVPKEVIEHIKQVGYNSHPDHIWDSIRNILKKKNLRLYYNRIPTILQILGFSRKIDFQDKNSFVIEVVNEFKRINYKFEAMKKDLNGRKYFPSLRFIAFKLLEKHGANFQYKIPFVRTPKKMELLEKIWREIS